MNLLDLVFRKGRPVLKAHEVPREPSARPTAHITKMREEIYDLICASLLGLGNMCLFMGYDTQMTIVEPVLRSVNDRAPSMIDRHAGFYGAGLCTVFFMLASLVSPCVLAIIGSKKTLLLGSLLFTLHLGSFQYIHYFSYYSTAAAVGVGYAFPAVPVFYSGHGGYLTEHSTKMTIERNSALTWALATSSTIAGGLVLALTAQRTPSVPSTDLVAVNDSLLDDVADLAVNGVNATAQADKSYREYADGEIRMVYGAFALVCVIGNLIFVFIPAKNVGNSISARFGKRRVGFVNEMKKLLDTFTDVRALHLVPIFCFIGLTTCFWVGAYPTTFVFSKALSGYKLLPALYLVGIGAGEIISSLLFLLAMVLALLSTPPAATHSPTSDPSPYLQPSPALVLMIAFLLGASDNSFNTSRTVLCALILPENIAQMYSMSKFFQPLTSSVIFFVAPSLSMTAHFQLERIKQIINVAICMIASSAVPIDFTPLTTPVPSHTAEENGPFTLSPDVEQNQQQAARNMFNSLTQLAQVLNEVAQAIQKDPEGFKAAVMKNLQSFKGSSYPGLMKPEAQ
ncbi:hypothetical protein PRIPAC_93274 [Pristionchus pacificus]|uniref:Uncharacterized protein n=1 Tax=Pristionchus pacificus TaxID=54126 RepID=A0A2A6BPW2_PRIPA|nr:hypothetical protein PRIPAC_93274 [Pristionchus pacificus]|eukprot:PDM67813.1 hypothetical protein PRIPAC_45857 [Pristionchus pacificus]